MRTAPWRAAAVTGVCLAFACSNQSFTEPGADLPVPPLPSGGGGASIAAAPLSYDGGCARFEITLSGTTGISVVIVAQPSCGSVVPVISGTPKYSKSTGLVQLPVALANQGTGTYQPPTWLLGWVDSMTQVSPAPPPKLTLTFQSPDSTVSDNAQQFPKARIWKYDTLLRASSAQMPRLDPGRTSRARTVKITVGSTLTKFRVQFQTRAGVVDRTVPPVPPDSIPAAVFNQLHATSNMLVIDGKRYFPQDALEVEFHERATQAERQAAIDLVGGEVIGGSRGPSGGGPYYVRIVGDGTLATIESAISRLQALPQVYDVGVVARGYFNYLTANDGANWKQWRISAAKADGGNWGAEAVSGPLAWGCEVGDSGLLVGLADGEFRANNDLTPNLDPSSASQLTSTVTTHGTSVASIVAAGGNNGQGMTGLMWRARLVLDDYILNGVGFAPADAANAVERLARRGVRIINLSSGINWSLLGHLPVITSRADSLLQARYRNRLRVALARADSAGFRPLVVLSAGNDGIDAWWNGFPAVKNDFPDRILVVGATNLANSVLQSGSLSSFSNRGPLVDVVAPGENVYSLTTSLTPVTGSGTSLAAPHVTGIAGLLLSFDRGLTTDSIRKLVLIGASRDGRRMSGIPFVNAYESLKAAAEADSAPLCGNRVWPDGNQIVVDRAGRSETLFDAETAVFNVSALHGGKRLRFNYSNAVGYSSGSWAPIPEPADTALPGLERSQGGNYASSHNGDSTAYATGGHHSLVDVFVLKTAATTWPPPLITFPAPTVYAGGPQECLSEVGRLDSEGNLIGYECTDNRDLATLEFGRSEDINAQGPTISYSPMGDEVVVAIPSSRIGSYQLGNWEGCVSGYGRCRRVVVHRVISTTAYAVNIASKSSRVLWHDEGKKVYWLGIAEAGQQIATNTGTHTYYFDFFSGSPGQLEGRSRGPCQFAYRRFAPGAAVTMATQVAAPCYEQVGTIAPLTRSKSSPLRR